MLFIKDWPYLAMIVLRHLGDLDMESITMEENHEKEANPDLGTVVLELTDTGAVNIRYSGDIKLYQVVGMLGVGMFDIGTKNFLVPYLDQQSVNLAQHLAKSDERKGGAHISDIALEKIEILNAKLGGIMRIIDDFRGHPSLGAR